MTTVETIETINRLLASEGIATVEAGGVEVGDAEALADPAAVCARIREFAPSEGWLCFTDQVEAFSAGDAMPDFERAVILYGELVDGDRTLHLRQDRHKWTAREIVRLSAGDCAIVTEEFVATRQNDRPFDGVRYETFWQRDDSSVHGESRPFVPYVSRFAGFSAKGGGR